MKVILVLGAGLSSASLFRYLVERLELHSWRLVVANSNVDALRVQYENHASITLETLDASDQERRRSLIALSDLVISMLPARFHVDIAKD
ncbi:MAG: saccharopine dehydrogenase, partial [Flavobacteriia bacterium]|nr:saccharopine dehydrogenase [Flavobacteriia bacterium]